MNRLKRRGGRQNRGHTPVERTMEEFMKTPFKLFNWDENMSFRTDIKEKHDAFMIEAELPGVEREDVNVELDNDLLIINVDQDYREEDEWNYIRQERNYGKYRRSFHIENIDEEGITAEFDQGVLEVYLPKEEPSKTKRRTIEIE